VSEYFPTRGFTNPHPIVADTDGEIAFPSGPLSFSSNPLLLPFPPRGSVLVSQVRTPYPPNSPPPHIPMAGVDPPVNRMDTIMATRYAPLVLPQPMNALLARDYLKYMPKFTGEEDITVEEHLATFYKYADNLNIENKDV
jgi:hypothetical protein